MSTVSDIKSVSLPKAPVTSGAALSEKMEAKATKGLLGRHVAWLKKPRTGIEKVGIACLEILECTALAVTLVGFYALVKADNISRKLDDYAKLKADKEPLTPPSEKIPEKKAKSMTETCNHVNYYAIKDGKLWYKPIHKPDAKWQLFYYDGMPKGRKPMEISADGANLAIKDDKGDIHYKKVLDESYDEKNKKYTYKDLTTKDNWYDRWFTLPLVQNIWHLFAKKRLNIPEDAECWGISHRGLYNHHWEDSKNVPHSEFSMVSTAYYMPKKQVDLPQNQIDLPKKKRVIKYSDPWLPGKFTHEIECPDDPDFDPDKFSPSSSTLFLRGKKTIKDPDGTAKVKTQRYTRLADWDTLGLNPFLKYLWGQKAPPEQWVLQPDIPLEGKATDSGDFSIHQTGQGNAARELRVEGTDSEGNAGCYCKMINETDPKDWKFHKYEVSPAA